MSKQVIEKLAEHLFKPVNLEGVPAAMQAAQGVWRAQRHARWDALYQRIAEMQRDRRDQ